VQTVRHAVSLDERRSVFQVTRWTDCHEDLKEVWFAGDHSDEGGGHKFGNSPLADATLVWMLGEATDAGLLLDEEAAGKVKRLKDSERAPSTESRDLWSRGSWIQDWIPRVELNNQQYPPTRRLKFWPTGKRKPADHSALLLHWTVEERGQTFDRDYRRETLVRQIPAAETITVDTAKDLEIRGFVKRIDES
jgi:Uncharacterized alpha/beta hydrolase domain (DUF2235)